MDVSVNGTLREGRDKPARLEMNMNVFVCFWAAWECNDDGTVLRCVNVYDNFILWLETQLAHL